MDSLGVGLIHKIRMYGSSDPERFQRRFGPELRVSNGYAIQHTPHEVAALISALRGQGAGGSRLKRMLCVGAQSLGVERVLVEHCGVISADVFCGGPFEAARLANILEMKNNGVGVNTPDDPKGIYDMVTFYGSILERDVEAALRFSRQGTLIVFIGIGLEYKCPPMRKAWMKFRAGNYVLMQSGAERGQGGIGLLRVTQVDGVGEEKQGEQTDGETGESASERVGEIEGLDVQGVEAPWGKKLDGTPKKRPGRPVPV